MVGGECLKSVNVNIEADWTMISDEDEVEVALMATEMKEDSDKGYVTAGEEEEREEEEGTIYDLDEIITDSPKWMEQHDTMFSEYKLTESENNFASVSFSVLVCPSVLTMSFPAPCADSACPSGMLTCHAVLLSLLKKSGKVFVTLFPRFPPPWPAPLRHQVFDVIKIATSLMVCFLQRRFHHRWQKHGTVFLTKIEPESSRSSAGVLSLNTPAVPHQIQAIILKNCSSRSRLSLFQHREVCPAMDYL